MAIHHSRQTSTTMMDAKHNRKSRAPWQMLERAPNPYESPAVHLQPIKSSGASIESAAASRRQNRRLSIHQSAAQHIFDAGLLPPLPVPAVPAADDDFVGSLKSELRHRDVGAVDDFYLSLTTQRKQLDFDLKTKINENQQNILQLTSDLKITQDELVRLRTLTKELYSILGEFSAAAQRRLALDSGSANSTPGPASSTSSAQGRGRARDRLSVFLLEKMWAAELQLLYKHVDGAQKYVQPVPGRHVLAESGRWHEINVGTWKPTKAIHLFLLSDLVLVAARRSQHDGVAKRLQALHCWPLGAVDLESISPPPQVGGGDSLYVINLRANSLSFVYQTDRYDHFTRVVAAFRKGKAAVAQREREAEEAAAQPLGLHRSGSSTSLASATDENPDKRQLRDSLRSSTPGPEDPAGARTSAHRHSQDILLKDISARVHLRNRSHDLGRVDLRAGGGAGDAVGDARLTLRLFADLKTTEDKIDEVDVHLAHCEYTSAVGLIKHIENRLALVVERLPSNGTSSDSGAAAELRLLVDVVRLKIESRKVKVQQELLFRLHSSIATIRLDELSSIVEFYVSFGRLDDAVATILDAMLAHLANTVGKLIAGAHGATRVDVVNYLANLTIVYVLIVRRAADMFRTCVEPVLHRGDSSIDSSGFVTWYVGEMALLVEAVKKHAAGTLLVEVEGQWRVKDPRYYGELVGMVQPQLLLLRDAGLDVGYLFDDILNCEPV